MSIIADCIYDLKRKLESNPDLNIVEDGVMNFLNEWRVLKNGTHKRKVRLSDEENQRRLAIYNSCTSMADMVSLMGIGRTAVQEWIRKRHMYIK